MIIWSFYILNTTSLFRKNKFASSVTGLVSLSSDDRTSLLKLPVIAMGCTGSDGGD